jgi:hypothetical protein
MASNSAGKYIRGTFTANETSASIFCKSTAVVYVGASGGATFDGGTVAIQFLGPDGQWYPSDQTFSAADVKSIDLPIPSYIRLSLSGSTSPDLDYAIQSNTTAPNE